MKSAIHSHRQLSFDAIRALALFLVVLVHTHQGPLTADTISHSLQTFFFFLGKLGVPLFVMVSGALLLPKIEPPLFFYKKRLQKIILPWIFWTAAYCSYKISQGVVNLDSPSMILKNLFIVGLTDFWFIPMILGVYVLVPYFRVLVQSKVPITYLLIAWFCVTSLLPFLFLGPLFPGSASSGLLTMSLSFSGYFLLGWYALSHWQNRVSTSLLVGIISLSGVLYVASAYFFKNDVYRSFFALQDYFSPPLVIGSTAAFLLIHTKATRVTQSTSKRIILKLSELSYGIFLSHVLVSSVLFNLFPVSGDTLLSWFIRAILVYSCSAVLIFLGTQIPSVRKLIT